ncbi:RrF2 family transcriptional regulator [Arcticibacterium luteifluviistationis]|uniref:Transcriptional regulator n=1 Tax=Arcticibacterium luteifluviistationis TaxID=1784714 RepID=A0A2Z4GCE6_9BACT|nr:Rrf2 family transcriptional regulator [Arcticibacterium luteifluviistationis]AWV98807.1 transcriptional regulator [Arcticibacterium luteifluviistationis]
MFSKSCEYGIRASIYITEQSELGRKVGLKEVAKAINSPEAFTSKILQQLTRSDVLISEKGPHGGFSVLANTLDTVTLSHVVTAIDGDKIYTGCGLGLEQCNEKKPCPVHDQFKGVRDRLRDMLETTTLKSLTTELSEGLTFLKR